MAWTFALSLGDQVEKVGAYVGFAAFFGLAALTVLYFAQAKELKRLRDWAGRAPERARELEERVVLQAEQARRVHAQPIAAPVAAATPAGEATAEEAETEQEAVAVAAAEPEGEEAVEAQSSDEEGAAEEELPAAGIAAAAVAAATARAGTLVADRPSVVAPPENGEYTASNGSPPAREISLPTVPRAATAAARAAEAPAVVPPAPPEPAPEPEPERAPEPQRAAALDASRPSATVPPRRTVPINRAMRPTPPPSRGSSSGRRPAAIAAIVGVLLVGGVFLITQLGGDDDSPPPNTPAPAANGQTQTTGADQQTNTTASTDRGDVTVAVYNGTTVAGLAKSISDKLVKAGFAKDAPTGNYTDQTRPTTEVLYATGFYRAAREAARVLEVKTRLRRIDTDTQALAGPNAEVVVIAGADQAP